LKPQFDDLDVEMVTYTYRVEEATVGSDISKS